MRTRAYGRLDTNDFSPRNKIATLRRQNSLQPETVRSNSQSAYTASLNAERSSALRLTEATTLTHTSSYASRSSSPSSPGKARSRSPAKKVEDLSSAVPPTYFSQLGASQKVLPVHLRNLNRDVTGAGKRSVLPQSLRVCVRHARAEP